MIKREIIPINFIDWIFSKWYFYLLIVVTWFLIVFRFIEDPNIGISRNVVIFDFVFLSYLLLYFLAFIILKKAKLAPKFDIKINGAEKNKQKIEDIKRMNMWTCAYTIVLLIYFIISLILNSMVWTDIYIIDLPSQNYNLNFFDYWSLIIQSAYTVLAGLSLIFIFMKKRRAIALNKFFLWLLFIFVGRSVITRIITIILFIYYRINSEDFLINLLDNVYAFLGEIGVLIIIIVLLLYWKKSSNIKKVFVK